MPRTLSVGSNGPDVIALQKALNIKLPQPPLLNPDGIFGPKTLARVKAFQKASGLTVDGVVGPKTWAALTGVPAQIPVRTGCNCGMTENGNQSLTGLFQFLLTQAGALGLGAFAPPDSGGGGAPIPIVGGTIKPLSVTQIGIATPVYGSSLDFTTIFTTDKTGAQNRPFTIAVPNPNGPGFVQIMNLGTSPSNSTLIHELMHCWQSQHASIKVQYMATALANQGAAVARSELAAILDSSVKSHTDSRGNSDFPEQFPFSAYAYVPGSDLDAYGAEQAANAVEHGDTTVCATVKGATANAVVAKNETSLKLLTACGDRRTSGIVY